MTAQEEQKRTGWQAETSLLVVLQTIMVIQLLQDQAALDKQR